jgi:hypothetical protein
VAYSIGATGTKHRGAPVCSNAFTALASAASDGELCSPRPTRRLSASTSTRFIAINTASPTCVTDNPLAATTSGLAAAPSSHPPLAGPLPGTFSAFPDTRFACGLDCRSNSTPGGCSTRVIARRATRRICAESDPAGFPDRRHMRCTHRDKRSCSCAERAGKPRVDARDRHVRVASQRAARLRGGHIGGS